MILAALVWGAAAEWLLAAAVIAGGIVLLLAWGYWRAPSSGAVRALAGLLKAAAVLILVVCLLEPLFSGTRARPGANQFVVLADNSQSMTLRDRGAVETRGKRLQTVLADKTSWSARLSQDFDVRRYAFDSQLRAVPDFKSLTLDGGASALAASLSRLSRRYQGRPLAGVLLLTDGNATDAQAVDQLVGKQSDSQQADRLPPIYPVLVGSETPAGDVSLERIAITQTSFEDAPVTLAAQVTTSGYRGRSVIAQLLDETGRQVDQQKAAVLEDGKPLALRFLVRPEKAGISFYRVRVAAEGEQGQFDDPGGGVEATLANNTRLVTVDRGGGLYRVLYVAGRPNWEFKSLRRAIEEDDQVQLTGLLRIANREPKFDFRSRSDERTNPLFRGFDPEDKDQVEQYDQPVIVRMGTLDETELRDGFPKSPEDLYRFHAVILDDLEAEFFTQDQMLLLKDFVRQRGGGLLMLGGQESFKNGRFERTPIGDLLPVYLDELPPPLPDARYRLALTREGWLEPWVRLRGAEEAERKRLNEMPGFLTINQVRGVKPGATVLARADIGGGRTVPALVEQRFGHGRAAALLIGDLWRWGLRRPPDGERDMEKAWRQTVRWLVADVPQRVEVDLRRADENPSAPLTLAVEIRDAAYKPLENASVTIRVTAPGGEPLDLIAEPSDRKGGLYEAVYVPRQPGAYRAAVTATAADGSEVGQVQTGWTSDPAAEEFRELRPNRELLEKLAQRTGGELVRAEDLDRFVADLPTRKADITEPYVSPLWHRPWVFLLAIACLCGEWGLRRWKGLP